MQIQVARERDYDYTMDSPQKNLHPFAADPDVTIVHKSDEVMGQWK
jgi:hypothetical protein